MHKERANQVWTRGDVGQLSMGTVGQLFARSQRTTRDAGSLGIAPDPLVRIQVRRIAWQEVQRQLSLQAVDVGAHDCGLVRRQTIDH